MKAKLVLTSKDRQTVQEVPFDRPNITIGRKPSNDLSFNRPEISGSHAAFLFEHSQYFVMDLGSTNGTLLNGAQLVAREKYGLQDKDVITVAPYTIQFVMEDESMDTMIEVVAQPSESSKKHRSGTAPDLTSSAAVKTGTEEHLVQEPAAKAAPVNKPVATKQIPPQPEPSPPPATPSAPIATPAAAPPRNVVISEPSKTPSAITDYIWLGIGAVLVLAALGLIIFVFVGL